MREVQIVRKDGGMDTIATYSVHDFPYDKLTITAISCRGKKPKQYIYDFVSFDIETTTIESNDTAFGFMYHWQACIGNMVITGRSWNEFFSFLDRVENLYKISYEKRLCIYVHNLGFEFQFLRDFLVDRYGELEIFATKSRQPIRVTTKNGFEFRCSYKLTNMTLNKATLNELGVTHIKAVGDLDYRKIRTPETPLTDAEFGYCVSDVVSLYELIKCKMKNEYDNIETIPMTSTGYVRRDCRKACRKDTSYRPIFNKLTINKEVYTLLKESGRGGNTHANRYLSGRIWENVDSFDFVSDYPAMMMLYKYPMSKFTPYGEIENITELEKLCASYACLFRLVLTDLRLKDNIAMPYIPISKCTSYIKKADDSNIELRLDNGRVLSAPMVSITVTDIDYEIIKKQYAYKKIGVSDLHIAKYDYLPKPILDTVMKYFKDKTELKYQISVESDKEKKENLQYLYAKSKNRLNGIFGMCYTDPVHEKILVNESGEWESETPDINEALDKFYKSRNSFLYYAWGVWITCHARKHLEELIKITGQEKTIYCDTDSSKATGVNLEKIEQFNKNIIALCEERGSYYDCNGKRYYLGIAEKENKVPIQKFKTLGAKKYCYVDDSGLHITISGVSKQKNTDTGEYLANEEMKTIDNFTTGFVFHKSGGLELVYNDNVGIHEIEISGCRFQTASNIAMLESTYTIGITGEYAELIGYNIYDDIDKI